MRKEFYHADIYYRSNGLNVNCPWQQNRFETPFENPFKDCHCNGYPSVYSAYKCNGLQVLTNRSNNQLKNSYKDRRLADHSRREEGANRIMRGWRNGK